MMPGVLCQESSPSSHLGSLSSFANMNRLSLLPDLESSGSSSEEDSAGNEHVAVVPPGRSSYISIQHLLRGPHGRIAAGLAGHIERRGHSVPVFGSVEDLNQRLFADRRSSLQSHFSDNDVPSYRTNQLAQSAFRSVMTSIPLSGLVDASQAESNQEDKLDGIARATSEPKDRKSPSKRKSPSSSSSVQSCAYQTSPQTTIPFIDPSDSNESEPSSTKVAGLLTESVVCPDISSHHHGREVINSVFVLPIDDVFTFLFTNSKFMHDLHEVRHTTDVAASEWKSNPETNQKIRQVTYTVTLPTNSFGPKVSHVTETQVISAFSKPSEIYTIDAEACNGGIPYADYFSVSNHWCLTRECVNETRLCVWTEVKYKKSVWGFMKSVIDKNAFSGMKSLINDISTSLLLEADKTSQKPLRRRRRRALSKSSDMVESLPIQGDKIKDSHKATQVPSRKTAAACASPKSEVVEPKSSVRSTALLFLCVLLGVNAFLYYRLYALEDKMVNGVRSPVAFDPGLFKRSEDVPVQEWVKILHEQEALHSAEVDRWKRAVSEAADHLKKAEESLRNLHTSIPHNQASKVQSLLRHLQLLQQIQDQRPYSSTLKPPDERINIPTEHEESHDL